MADNVEENINTNVTLVLKIENIMDTIPINNIEATNDVDTNPTMKEQPLLYTSSFEPSVTVANMLNEVTARTSTKRAKEATCRSEDVPSPCPTPACTTSSLPPSLFHPSCIPPPTPEISTTTLDVAMQDDTCPTPYCGPGLTLDPHASTPRPEVLPAPFPIPSPHHETPSRQPAEPPTANIMTALKTNLEATLFSTTPASNEKIAPHLNPTNRYIVHLRDDTHCGWMQIATVLNSPPATHPPPELSVSNPSAPPFHPSAVYARYIRTKYHLRVATDAASMLARQQAKPTKRKRPAPARRGSTATVDSDDSDGRAGGKGARRPEAVGTAAAKGPVVWEGRMDRLLKDAVREVKSEFWEGVARRVGEKKGGVVQPSECAKRFVEVEKE
ncbi:hypothetical protein MMC15_002117 [Xylographa vitiligo]|nr:hypothetical protein [Xylographa vitiligo]